MSEEKFIRNRTALFTLIAASLVVLISLGVRQTFGMFFMDFPGINWWMLVLSLPVLFYSGHAFYVNAWKQAKHFTSNMDTSFSWYCHNFNM